MLSRNKSIMLGASVSAFGIAATILNSAHASSIENAMVEARIKGRQEALQLSDAINKQCQDGKNELLCGELKMDYMLMEMGARVGFTNKL